ncbi:YibE/F family protein [Streptacidiphilus jiangxiensis]|uniref:YibE/F family protein n=1 Tax=Streptacidiphilus jiangxiensis TaxID=235985 RepID=UPI0005A9B465|nr:YibE/F family protein [Streptacidiphilus jiangxiensis]
MAEHHHSDGHGHGPGPAQGHGHSHDHGPASPASARLRVLLAAVLVPFALAVLSGLYLLWPAPLPTHAPTGTGFDQITVSGTVTATRTVPCGQGAGATGTTGDSGTCTEITFQLTSGKDSGRSVTQTLTPDQTAVYSAGEKIVVDYSPTAPTALQYTVEDADRSFPVAVLAGVFALAVVLVGRLRGLAALVALAISFLVLSLFVLPAILGGEPPLAVAVVGGGLIMLLALYLCHGFSARTSVAVLGTMASLALIGGLGQLFIGLTRLTGNTSDETAFVHSLFPGIQLPGLLLAGVIIGSLGVLNDVTVTQASSVWELHAANPRLGARALYRAAIRIGRDHIASTVNTLVMAYAGAALPLMLLFSLSHRGVWQVATSEIVAEELVRTLVGSIGLIASVPLTTALAAFVASRDLPEAAEPPLVPAQGRPSRASHRRTR